MSSRFLIFIGVIVVLIAYTAYKVSYFFPENFSYAGLLTLGLFGVMLGWQFGYRIKPESPASHGFTVFAWIGAIVTGLWATYILVSIPLDIGDVVLSIASPKYRDVFDEKAPTYAIAASVLMTLAGFVQVLIGPKAIAVKVPIKGLPRSFRKLRIVQISDLHVGPTVHFNYVRRVVDMTMKMKPDLIAITGDLADGTPKSLERHLVPLFDLKAPLGVFYVTGNHEYYWGGNAWVEQGKRMGFKVLLDENHIVEKDGASILVGGVPDVSASSFVSSHLSKPSLAAQTSQKPDLRILLAHRPDSSEEGEKAGFDLMLCGHTHAGQFFPWSLLIPLAHTFYKGLRRLKNMWVYVNAGTGYWGPPHRFGIPCELTCLEVLPEETSQA